MTHRQGCDGSAATSGDEREAVHGKLRGAVPHQHLASRHTHQGIRGTQQNGVCREAQRGEGGETTREYGTKEGCLFVALNRSSAQTLLASRCFATRARRSNLQARRKEKRKIERGMQI